MSRKFACNVFTTCPQSKDVDQPHDLSRVIEVAQWSEQYGGRGILDIPLCEEELQHTSLVFQEALGLVRRRSLANPADGSKRSTSGFAACADAPIVCATSTHPTVRNAGVGRTEADVLPERRQPV